MRVPENSLDFMFRTAGVDKFRLHSALRKMGKSGLKTKEMKDLWDPNNPTKNYCYVVSEFVKAYFLPDSVGWKVMVPGDPYGHRFVKWGDVIVDLTVDQFDNWEEVDYTKGKKCPFMPPSPSKRAKQLWEYYNESSGILS